MSAPAIDWGTVGNFVAQGRAASEQPSTGARGDDVRGILDSLSGLAGDVVGVVNAFQTDDHGRTQPVARPSALSQWLTGNNLLSAGIVVVVIIAAVWAWKKVGKL